MMDVTNYLPHTSTRSIYDKGLANAIANGYGVLLYAIVLVAVAMHMEYMGCTAVGHDIAEYLVVRIHLEGRVVREDIAVDSVCLSGYLVKWTSMIFGKYETYGRGGAEENCSAPAMLTS
jgi:hypothetical protein